MDIHILNYQSRGRTKLFASLVTRKSVQNIRGIFEVSQGKENCFYNVQKCNLAWFKITLQNKDNMLYYFLCDCQINTKNIFAKFDKTYQTFLKKKRKIQTLCPPLPPKRKTQSSVKQRAIPPIKICILTTVRVLSRIYEHIFIRNEMVFKK